jgi:hypothetical protein
MRSIWPGLEVYVKVAGQEMRRTWLKSFGVVNELIATVEDTVTYTPNVTCADYRAERRLESLRRELSQPDLDQERRAELEAEAAQLERALGMD